MSGLSLSSHDSALYRTSLTNGVCLYARFCSELVTVYSNLIDLYKPVRIDMDIEESLRYNTAALVSGLLLPGS